MREIQAILLLVGIVTVFPVAGCSNTNRPDAEQLLTLHRQQADAAEAAGDYRGAAHHLQLLYAEQAAAQTAVRLGRNLRYLGRTEDARAVLTEELDRQAEEAESPPSPRQPSSEPAPMTAAAAAEAEVRLELGKVEIARGDATAAIAHLDRVTVLDPTNAEAHAALGVANDLRGRFETAEAHYRAALVLAPDDPEILNNLGLSRALAGDYAEAVATLQRAAVLPGSPPQVLMNLAFLKKLRQGDVPPAQAAERRLGIAEAPGRTQVQAESPEAEGRPFDIVPIAPAKPPERAPVTPGRSPRAGS